MSCLQHQSKHFAMELLVKKIYRSPCCCLSLLEKDRWFLIPFVFQVLCRELSLETWQAQLITWKWSIWQTQRSFRSQANGENIGDVVITVVINSILSSDNPFGYIKSICFFSRFYFTLRLWAHIFICILSSCFFFIVVFIPNQREKEWKVKWGW